MEHVKVERRDGVALVTLVDRERRNAMTATMVAEIVDTFDELESDGTVGAVVLTGEAPAFCSGADVAALGSLSEGRDDTERRAIGSIYEGFLRVLRSPLPTVAAVNGPAVGAGLNLALACTVRIAGVSARFDTRFLRIGIHPGGGHAWMLERAVGPADRGGDDALRRAGRRAPRRGDRPGVGLPPGCRAHRRGRRVRGPGRVRAARAHGRRERDTEGSAVAARLRGGHRDGDHPAVLVTGPGLV